MKYLEQRERGGKGKEERGKEIIVQSLAALARIRHPENTSPRFLVVMYLVPVNLAPEDAVQDSPKQRQRREVLQRAWHCALPGQGEAEMRSEAVNSLSLREAQALFPLHTGLLSTISFEESERERRRRKIKRIEKH